MKVKGVLFGLFIGLFNFISMLIYKTVANNFFARNMDINVLDMFCISLMVGVLWTIIIVGVISRRKS